MTKRFFIAFALLTVIATAALAKRKEAQRQLTDREKWVELCYKISAPVLENMSKGELQKNMEVELSPNWDGRNKKVTYIEAFGRLMAGI